MSIIEYSDGKDPIDNYVITKLGITPLTHDIECGQVITTYTENDYLIDARIYNGDRYNRWYIFKWDNVEIYMWAKDGINVYVFDVVNEKIISSVNNEFEVEQDILLSVMEKMKNIREVFDLVYTKGIFKSIKTKKLMYDDFESIYIEHKSGH